MALSDLTSSQLQQVIELIKEKERLQEIHCAGTEALARGSLQQEFVPVAAEGVTNAMSSRY
jgi:hypothetical protein